MAKLSCRVLIILIIMYFSGCHALVAFAGLQEKRIEAAIKAQAKKNRLPSSLIKAVVKTESNFNPWAISQKGAKGLMQLMPEVCAHYGVKQPFHIESNVRAGTAYLREMLDRFRSLPLALAAYNAGPEAVEKYKSVPPYAETKNYIIHVYKNYNAYRKQINRHAPALILKWPEKKDFSKRGNKVKP